MKKLLFLTTVVLSMISSDVIAQKKALTKEEQQASNIIQYSNAVIELNNAYTKYLSYYRDSFTTADNNFNKAQKKSTMPMYAVKWDYTGSLNKTTITNYKTQLKNTQSFEGKEEISQLVEKAISGSQKVTEDCKVISDYFADESYKEDRGYKQYPIIKENLYTSLMTAYTDWTKASELAAKAGDKAELVLLKRSKIASLVIPMKTDLISLNEILNMFNEDMDVAAIQQKVNELKPIIEKNKEMTGKDFSKLSDIYYKDVYKTFYNNANECLKSIDFTLEKITKKHGEDAMKSSFGYARGYYGKVIENYNTFIKQ